MIAEIDELQDIDQLREQLTAHIAAADAQRIRELAIATGIVVVPIPARLLVESKEQLAAEMAERRKNRTRTYSVEEATDYLRQHYK